MHAEKFFLTETNPKKNPEWNSNGFVKMLMWISELELKSTLFQPNSHFLNISMEMELDQQQKNIHWFPFFFGELFWLRRNEKEQCLKIRRDVT